MNPNITKIGSGFGDPALLLAGAQRAARLASSIAEVATQWAESSCAGLDAARDARDAAMLAGLVVANAGSSPSDDSLRIVAADAWEAVQRALDATQRVTRAVSAVYR